MLIITGLAVLVLILIIFIKTFTYKSRQVVFSAETGEMAVNDNAVKDLSQVIQFETLTPEPDKPENFNAAEYLKLHDFLQEKFPYTHEKLTRETVNKLSLLYKWEGRQKDRKPVIVLAHQDVVPADKTNLDAWTQQPFSGAIEAGKIWGRGALDMKSTLVAVFEAVELLLQEGFQPERTIYLAFGHDEEVGGTEGAKKIAEYLKAGNVKAEFLLDEGLVVTRGLVPGLKKDTALIGIAEKGNLSLELTADLEGGHSSMPASETAVDLMAASISKLKASPFPARICKPVDAFLKHIGPEMPFSNRIVFANQWLFKRLILNTYKQKRSGNAMVRTTTAPTIFKSGHKDNIVPYTAKAVVNFRLLPGTSSEKVIERVKQIINDERIKIEKLPGHYEPSNVSDIDSHGYKIVSKTIQQNFPGVLIAPSLMIAGTDSKHYREIADNIYRFSPFVADGEKLKKIHGVNENISTEGFKRMVRFYYDFFKNLV